MNTNDVLRELKDWSVTQPRNSPDVWTATTTPNSISKTVEPTTRHNATTPVVTADTREPKRPSAASSMSRRSNDPTCRAQDPMPVI